MNITKKKQIHRFREETTGYPWEEGKGRGNTGVGGEKGYCGLYDIMCVKLSKTAKHYRV